MQARSDLTSACWSWPSLLAAVLSDGTGGPPLRAVLGQPCVRGPAVDTGTGGPVARVDEAVRRVPADGSRSATCPPQLLFEQGRQVTATAVTPAHDEGAHLPRLSEVGCLRAAQ